MTDASNKDLLAASIWAVLTVVAVAFSQSTVVRLVVGVPLVLFVTGHVFLRAIGFPVRSLSSHCAYAIGASIGICVLGGLALNLIHSLNPLGWSIWLLLVTAGFSFIAGRRRAERGFVVPALRLEGFRRVHGALLGVAVVIGCGAYAIAVHGEAMYEPFTYTQFWMLPASHEEPNRLLIGVKNAESAAELFDIEVTLNGRMVGLWHSVKVAPGATWLATLNVRVGPDALQKAEARLYRSGDRDIYRRVSAVIPGEQAARR